MTPDDDGISEFLRARPRVVRLVYRMLGSAAEAEDIVQDVWVRWQMTTDADVTEGSGGAWERLHYDWSDPNRVVMKTTDSNLWGGSSGHVYTFTRRPDGTTDVDAVVVREGKNLKGRMLGLVLGTVGKGCWRARSKTPSRPLKPVTAPHPPRRGALRPVSRGGAWHHPIPRSYGRLGDRSGC